MLAKVDQRNGKASGDTQKRMDDLTAMLEQAIALRAIPGPQGEDGQDGAPGPAGQDGSPDSGDDIVDKINALPTDDPDCQIDYAHIKNAPVMQGGRVMHGGFRNLQIFDEQTLISKAAQFMKFVGAGVQATVSKDGVITITVPGGSGTAADQLATDSGDHTTFTISHTPTANTLLLINENTGQAVPASAYTNTGTSITFTSSQQIDDGAGNLVTPTFRARYFY